MTWEITEDNETLTFKRYYKEAEVFLEIKLDHGPASLNIFDGEVYNKQNELIGMATTANFHECLDRLLALARTPAGNMRLL